MSADSTDGAGARRSASGRAPVVHNGGGSAGGFVVFVVVVVLLLAAIIGVRVRRRAGASASH
jgi:hypothetical protein